MGLIVTFCEHSPGGSQCQIHSTHDWYPIRILRLNPPFAAGPPKSATPGQYRRDVPGHASEQVPMEPLRGVIFRIWSTRMSEPLMAGIGQDRLISHRFAQAAGDGCGLACTRHPDAVCTAVVRLNARSIRPGAHSGLARKPNSGNMDRPWCRRCDLPPRQLARGQEHRSENGTGLAPAPAFEVRAQGLLARFHELRQ